MSTSPAPRYEHTQTGLLHLFGVMTGAALVVIGGGRLLGLLSLDMDGAIAAVLLVGGAILVLAGLTFRQLTVRGDADALVLRFGPVPLFRKRVPYDAIRSFERSRSTFIDGWGIHWVPGRGWTWNVHGLDCVELELEGGRTLRIGTDDPGGLAAHLEEATG